MTSYQSHLEMVDHVDRRTEKQAAAAAASSKGKQGIGDLFLKVEDTDEQQQNQHRGDYAPSELEYNGLGLEDEVRRILIKKRKTVIVGISILLICVLALVGYSKIQYGGATSASGKNKDKNTSSGGRSNNISFTAKPSDSSPFFTLCSPPRKAHSKHQSGLDVFHMGDIKIVPETPHSEVVSKNKDDDDAYTKQTEHAFSDMDMNEKSSLLSVGLDLFAGPATNDIQVGMVRAFGYSCVHKRWQQVGQDLLGSNSLEQFGHKISSSGDGRVVAISAPQNDYDGGTGFVEVYHLTKGDDKRYRWNILGKRIDKLSTKLGWYSSVGHAIDLDDKGDTLAVLGVVDKSSYVIRVFKYNPSAKKWEKKGKNLSVTVSFADGYEYYPQLTLSDAGDKLTMVDPTNGLVTYRYDFTSDHWKEKEKKTAGFKSDEAWIQSADTDDAGELVIFSGWEENGDTYSNTIELIDFGSSSPQQSDSTNETAPVVFSKNKENINGTVVYKKNFENLDLDLHVALSDNGRCVAIVASKEDIDDDKSYYVVGTSNVVGAMTIVIPDKTKTTPGWKILGEGTNAEGIGIPGTFVTLSGDGSVAAVGSDTVVSLYGINVNSTKKSHTAKANESTGSSSASSTNTELAVNEDDDDALGNITKVGISFETCTPFPNQTSVSGHVGDIDKLPKRHDENTVAVAINGDGSVVAIGIDSYGMRGLVRVFGWDCTSSSYLQLGRDLIGPDEFDGFGQSIDLSSDGMTLAVGANQPPPGKSGYVEVYVYTDNKDKKAWKLSGSRMNANGIKDQVTDLGREVKLSHNGEIVMFSGSVISADGWWSSSFIRVMEYSKSGEWVLKGDDLVRSIEYDDNGSQVHISQSGDGKTLGVTGSYSNFLAKIYSFDENTKNWTETIVPPIKIDVKYEMDDDFYADYELDLYYESYFTGSGIAINGDGSTVAVSGIEIGGGENGDEDFATVRILKIAGGNYSLTVDPIEYEEDWSPSSVDVSDDGGKVCIGINTHGDSWRDQGALFVAVDPDKDGNGWNTLDKMDGRNKGDMLGSRVAISRDGTLAAASSRKGYVSLFRVVEKVANE